MGTNHTTKEGYEKDKFFLPLLMERFLADPFTGFLKNKKTGKTIGKPKENKYGSVGIRHEGKVIFFNTHKVIWLLCNGLIPIGHVINHKDGIKSNNKIDNLEVITELENKNHAKLLGLYNPSDTSGSKNGFSKFTIQDVIEIRKKLPVVSVIDIANEYNVNPQTIRYIKNNKSYTDKIYYP